MGINKRFLNNTMLSMVIQNNKKSKQNLSTTTNLHHPRHKIPTSIQGVESVTKPNHQTVEKTARTSSKVVISSKGRYNAYLADYKHKKEIEAKRENESKTSQTV